MIIIIGNRGDGALEIDNINSAVSGNNVMFPSTENWCLVTAAFIRKGFSDSELELENLRAFRKIIIQSPEGSEFVKRYEDVSRAILIAGVAPSVQDEFFSQIFDSAVQLSEMINSRNFDQAEVFCREKLGWLESIVFLEKNRV